MRRRAQPVEPQVQAKLSIALLPVAVLVMLASLGGVAMGGWKEDAQKCRDTKTGLDLRLHHCSLAIQSGQLSDQNLADTFYNRGLAYQEKGDNDRAIQDYDQAIRLDPNDAVNFTNRGNAYGAKGDNDRAIQDYDQALRGNPNLAPVFTERGNAYHAQGDYNRALSDFDRVVRLTPNANAFINRGVAYHGTGDNDRAIQDYDQAIRLDPSSALAFTDRANAYRSKGDYDRAIQDYDEALRINPKYVLAFTNRGVAYLWRGDYDRAIEDHGQAIRLDPNNALNFNNRGYTYALKGDYLRALRDFDDALRRNPSDVHAFTNRGLAHFYQGQFEAAVPDFAKAVQLQLAPRARYVVLWLYLAQTRAGQNARDELARAAARLNLSQWPGPVFSLYGGTMNQRAVLVAAEADPKYKRKRQCEAYFFVGQDLLLQGRKDEAARMFQAAVGTGVTNAMEYDGAKAELRRLGH